MSASITFTVGGQDAMKFKEKIRDISTREGMSMSEWIVEAIAEKMRGQNGNG